MKKILIATDFSKAAHNAALYGVELAKAFNAKVILFHAYQPMPVPNADPLMIVSMEDIAHDELRKLQEEYLSINNSGNIKIETMCEKGPVGDLTIATAETCGADIIVTGMKYGGRKLRQLFGSAVTNIAGKTTIPMLIVPEGVSYTCPKSIALASDISSESDIHILDALKEIEQRFHTRLYVVRVVQDKSQEVFEVMNRPYKLQKLAGILDAQYEYPEDKDIPHALNQFISGHHIDMLAMVPHKHSLVERWLVKSNTRSMIFKALVPLLILPDKRMPGIKKVLQKTAHSKNDKESFYAD